jgi:hypothetical protein
MVRIVVVGLLLPACASVLAGATTVTAAGLGTSALQRKAGGCYAICTADTTCNPHTGLCEKLPCGGLCGPDEHCEFSVAESKCAPGAPSDVASKAPGTQKTIPVLPPPPAISGGPPQVVPAAEQNPPSSR